MDGTLASVLAEIREDIDATSRRATEGPTRADRAALKRRLAAVLKQFAKALEFEIKVPGAHYSGLGNEELLDILAAQGRDFRADTRQLRVHVELALREAFEDEGAVPLRLEVEQEAKVAILEWVAARMDGRIRDERITALTPDYAKRKRATHPGRPVGKRTGALFDALTEKGRVKFT